MSIMIKTLSVLNIALSISFLCGMDMVKHVPDDIIINIAYYLAEPQMPINYNYSTFKDEHTQETLKLLNKYLQNVTQDYISFMITCKHVYRPLHFLARLPRFDADVFFDTFNTDADGNKITCENSQFFSKELKDQDMKMTLLHHKNNDPEVESVAGVYEFYMYYTNKKLYFCLDYYPYDIYVKLTKEEKLTIAIVENKLKEHNIDQDYSIWNDLQFITQYIEQDNINFTLGYNILSICGNFNEKYSENALLLILFKKYYSQNVND